MTNKLNVQAIFDSIDGECNGFQGAGQLSTFIRLKGCNFYQYGGCSYCDTKYANNPEPVNWMTVKEILEKVGDVSKVTITGGESLFQNIEYLVRELSDLNKDITVETNGSYPIFGPNFNVRWVVDFKLPSSGMTKHMKVLVFNSLREVDVIKFVISDEEDYKYANMLIQEHPNWKAKKVFSPATKTKYVFLPNTRGDTECIIDTEWPRQLAEMMIKDKIDAQFSLQIHKVLWPDGNVER